MGGASELVFPDRKFSIPYLKHESVPKTWFLDQMDAIPEDLENYALKPLYSFAGLGVMIAPKKEDIAAIPEEKRRSTFCRSGCILSR